MLEFREFARNILKDKYSKRFGNLATQIYVRYRNKPEIEGEWVYSDSKLIQSAVS